MILQYLQNIKYRDISSILHFPKAPSLIWYNQIDYRVSASQAYFPKVPS